MTIDEFKSLKAGDIIYWIGNIFSVKDKNQCHRIYKIDKFKIAIRLLNNNKEGPIMWYNWVYIKNFFNIYIEEKGGDE